MNYISLFLCITDNDLLFHKNFYVPEGDTTAEGGGLTFLSSEKSDLPPGEAWGAAFGGEESLQVFE